MQFDIWPWKTIEHLFYATSSLVHHFVAIGEFKLELQSGNAQGKSEGFDSCYRPSNLTEIGFQSSIFQPVWPRNLMDDPEK